MLLHVIQGYQANASPQAKDYKDPCTIANPIGIRHNTFVIVEGITQLILSNKCHAWNTDLEDLGQYESSTGLVSTRELSLTNNVASSRHLSSSSV